MSFAPNPGSLVKFRSGEYGLVVSVTPKETKIVPLGYGYPSNWSIYEIVEIIHEPDISDKS